MPNDINSEDTSATGGTPDNTGMVGALRGFAYGNSGNPLAQAPALLDAVLPAQAPENEDLAYRSAISAPTRTGALTEALGNAMQGQLEARNTRDKLRAAYMPLIMQSIVQSQQMTLAGAAAGRDYMKDIMPKVDSHLASMGTGKVPPTYQSVVQRLMQLGDEYQIPNSIMMSKLRSIPNDSTQIQPYLERLAAGTAGADKQLPSTGTNAAGQLVAEHPLAGTAAPLTAPGSAVPPPDVGAASGQPEQPGQPGQPGAQAGQQGNPNPTKPDVDWETATRGDVKTYEEGLRARAEAYKTMLARMNEQSQYVQQFQPGRYAKTTAGIAAAVKDIGSRLPSINQQTVQDLASRLLGAQQGTPEALAAQQTFEQLAQQETLAQLKSALGDNQRMNMYEYQNFQKNNLGSMMDPRTFDDMRKFYYKEAANAVNRYSSWADYVSDPSVKKPSVTGFDAKRTKQEFDDLLKAPGNNVIPARNPGDTVAPSITPTVQAPATPPAPGPASGRIAAPAQPVVAPARPVELSKYELGAKVGPTGKVYVMDHGVPRPAKPRGGPSAGTIMPTVNGGGT